MSLALKPKPTLPGAADAVAAIRTAAASTAGTNPKIFISPKPPCLPSDRRTAEYAISFTSVEFKGTKRRFVLRLKKGSYRFVCDPHSGIMHGSFKVSWAAITEGRAPGLAPPISVAHSLF